MKGGELEFDHFKKVKGSVGFERFPNFFFFWVMGKFH